MPRFVPILMLVTACASPEALREHVADVERGAEAPSDSEHIGAAAEAPAVVAPPPAPSPGPDAPPVLEGLAPWFGGAPLDQAYATWLDDDPAAAAPVFEAFAAAHPADPRALPARFLAAWASAASSPSEAASAARRFEGLAEVWPLMADIALLRAAELHAQAGALEPALATLDRLPADTAHAGRALALRARLLAQRDGGAGAARATLEEAAKADPARLLPESWDELATLRAAAGDQGPAEDARFELAVRHPSSELGQAALDSLTVSKLSGERRVRLGRALFDAGRYVAMRGVLGGLRAPKAAACEAWILLGRAAERAKKDDDQALSKADGFYDKALGCEGAPRADATFLAGRIRIATHPREGKKLLLAHAEEFPDRSTADDALLLVAESEKRPKKAVKALLQTLRRYPQGDMADAVAWDLVGPHVEARRWKSVLDTTTQVLEIAPDDVPGRHPGRYRYWRGRALWELGRKDEARAEWRTVFTRHPLSWYAVLSRSRLIDADGLVPALPAEVGPPDLRVPAALWRDVHFRRAVEWARLSGARYDKTSPFLSMIDAELERVEAAARPAGDAWAWTRITVLQLGGGYQRSMRLARSLEATRELPFPVGLDALPWKLAYPRPFAAEVERWATERALDPHWIWSVMRVESNFDPEAVSWANAIGLMQIILPTAKFLSKDTAHAPTRENLMRPEVAVELGTKYLQRLLDRHKVVPLASAGYNAGGGAVAKWRRQFGDVDVDEFVERIPYREAHLYAKSVTQTLARYLWLYRGELFTLDLSPVGSPDAQATAE